MASFNRTRQEVWDRVSRSQYYKDNLAGLNAHERHQQLISAALSYKGTSDSGLSAAAGHDLASIRTDEDVLRERHRFLRTAEDDADGSWEVRLARRYYDRLFKEFAIVDLSHYKQQQLGLRWRTQAEVVAGKGQLVCATKGCNEQRGLCSFEVNFVYREAGQTKQALVKVRVCPDCAYKLNYGREKQYKKVEGKEERSKRDRKAAAAATADEDNEMTSSQGFKEAVGGDGERPHKKFKRRSRDHHAADPTLAEVERNGGKMEDERPGGVSQRGYERGTGERWAEPAVDRSSEHGVGEGLHQQLQKGQHVGSGTKQQQPQPGVDALREKSAPAGVSFSVGAATAAAGMGVADGRITDQDIETFLDEVFAN
jgi:hypothetical protein